MDFFKFFFRYLSNYKGKLTFYILFTFVGAFFAVFSFTAIIPILNVLFQVSDKGIEPSSLEGVSSLKEIYRYVADNLLYFIQNHLKEKGPIQILLLSCLFWVGMTIIKNCFTYASSFLRAIIRHGIYRDMRQDLFFKIIHLPVDFFSKAYKGDVMSRITSDIIEVEAGIKKAMNLLIRDSINIIIPLMALFAISWRLTLFSLIVLPVFVWLMNKVSLVVQRLTLQAQNLMGINVSRFDQMMNGLRIIKIFSVEEEIKGQFVKQNETTRKRYIVRNWIADLSYPISEILLTIIAAVILYVGGVHVLNGESSMNGSVFIFFIVVLISIISPMMETIDEFFCIRQSIACIHRINFVLDHDTSVEECNPSDVKVENITSIVFDNVQFLYEENNPVLKGLSLNINGGQKYAIIGKTGAGKSTMMDILYRFRDVDSGSISINGKNINDWNVATLRRSLSYVNQQEFLFDDTILYNLTLGDTTYSQHHIDSVTKAIGLFDYISSLPDGYNTKVGDSGICLSGGQRQMVTIARALLKNTSLIILDEATSALDEHTESTVIKGIEKLMSDKTIIIISHHFNAIKDVDKVFVLDDGCLVATCTPQELIGSRFISPQ